MRHAEPWSMPFDVRLMNLISRLLLGVTIIGLCAGGVVWVIGQPQFSLRVIQVRGENTLEHNNEATLKVAVGSRIKGNFFTVDLEEVRAVFESVPWIRHVTVRRMWPYGLSVVVQEYQSVALWGSDRQTSYLMDVYGDIFEANGTDVEDLRLPLLDAPGSTDTGGVVWQMYQRMAALVIVLDRRIDVLRLSEQGTWSIRLDNGMEIVMGRGNVDDLEKKMRDFVQTVQVALKPYGARTLRLADLRYTDGYAVQIAGVTTTQLVAGEPAAGSRQP